MEKDKIVFKGSHPDSLYRVQADSGSGTSKMARILRVLRWPVALVAICIALAVFVYFLMPDNMDIDADTVNATYWEPVAADSHSHQGTDRPSHKPAKQNNKHADPTHANDYGTKTPEIDFYDADNGKSFDINSAIETNPQRILPIPPVFPTYIAPEVQYGNEKADSEKLRTPKLLADTTLPEDSTMKPHITQKPEKPLAIYFNDGSPATTTTTETITRAETVNDFPSYEEKNSNKNIEQPVLKTQLPGFKDQAPPLYRENYLHHKQPYNVEQEIPSEVQEFYNRRPVNIDVNFTSGHSKLFGISMEDAEKMKSTTQSSVYNTRVSPTLPTWRDGDDTTTKKYPINVNLEVPQCRSTRLALCRGVLPYDLAGAAATVNGVDVTALLSQIEYLVATNCSDRVRHFACALLEPECNPPPYPPKMPCYNLCKAIADNCEGQIPRELTPAFKCNQYSRNNCVAAKIPCYSREFACNDGSCVPRDWICDGTPDCSSGEDEATCVLCDQNEFRCRSGSCILKRWLCDGYADCPDGEDESEDQCYARDVHAVNDGRGEPGEESAGSAPAPAIRRPNRVPGGHLRSDDLHRTGENENSKELLVTSDSGNIFKRNFTRRPSLSRLTPYTRASYPVNKKTDEVAPVPNTKKSSEMRKFSSEIEKSTQKSQDSGEDINIGDLGFFDEFDQEKEGKDVKRAESKTPQRPKPIGRLPVPVPAPNPVTAKSTRLNKSVNKLEKVIDGAAMMRKAAAAAQEETETPDSNATTEKLDDFPTNGGSNGPRGSISSHVSPCPSGELRCVDGRCITLAQLCDGTIDCSDHADEDNCYT